MSGNKRFTAGRSRILWEVTILVLIIFIIAVLAIWYFYNKSTDTLIKESKERLITTEGENISTGYDFASGLIFRIISSDFKMENLPEISAAFQSKEVIPLQTDATKLLKELVEKGTMGIKVIVTTMEAYPPVIPEPMVLMSSDIDLLFTDVPDSVQKVIDSGEQYGIVEEGIPEWDLEGEQLVSVVKAGDEWQSYGASIQSVGVKPIQEELESINKFYDEQKSKATLVFITVAGIALVALLVVTFFVLSFLIKERITKPIDELSDAAEKVLDGDLDFEIPVKKGEEFFTLKKAFNEMIRHVREILQRSLE